MPDPKPPASDEELDAIGRRLFAQVRAENPEPRFDRGRPRRDRDGGDSSGWDEGDGDGDGCGGGDGGD